MKISVADSNQFPIIRNIAKATWPSVYGNIISREQLDYMIEMMYSLDSLNHQFHNLRHTFFIAFDVNNEHIGFASCSAVNDDSKSYKLHKLYVLPSFQSNGAGKLLLDTVVEFSTLKKAKRIELQVNKKNSAVNFYKKNGFEIYEEIVMEIGNGFVMDDYLMQTLL